ncbi:hypothetical protein ACFQPF_03625 [Fictibacillus iocasae]|uniref:MarR family transcriptional regulator n=1 Tax=Fictibacillus iocasae TaxID=2715437 RepID=A0ABW2NJS8_9BACL
MPKKITPYITQFFNRDKLAFTALSKVGHVSDAQLKQCGLANSRIKNYVRDKLVEKVVIKEGKTKMEAYKLTKLGRELAESKWALRNHYHAQSPAHDLLISNKYFSLSEVTRGTWQTETQAREKLLEYFYQLKNQGQEQMAIIYEDMLSKGLISMPDGIYTNEQGLQVSFEVITNNYGVEELQAKEAFIEIMKTEYETTRV